MRDCLADRDHLVYYDQRGRGKSADGVRADEITLSTDVEDIERVRRYFGLEAPTLLGHSWGTVLTLERLRSTRRARSSFSSTAGTSRISSAPPGSKPR